MKTAPGSRDPRRRKATLSLLYLTPRPCPGILSSLLYLTPRPCPGNLSSLLSLTPRPCPGILSSLLSLTPRPCPGILSSLLSLTPRPCPDQGNDLSLDSVMVLVYWAFYCYNRGQLAPQRTGAPGLHPMVWGPPGSPRPAPHGLGNPQGAPRPVTHGPEDPHGAPACPMGLGHPTEPPGLHHPWSAGLPTEPPGLRPMVRGPPRSPRPAPHGLRTPTEPPACTPWSGGPQGATGLTLTVTGSTPTPPARSRGRALGEGWHGQEARARAGRLRDNAHPPCSRGTRSVSEVTGGRGTRCAEGARDAPPPAGWYALGS
ncbi:unnamed protein product [Gadus morhua 'NCC']